MDGRLPVSAVMSACVDALSDGWIGQFYMFYTQVIIMWAAEKNTVGTQTGCNHSVSSKPSLFVSFGKSFEIFDQKNMIDRWQ